MISAPSPNSKSRNSETNGGNTLLSKEMSTGSHIVQCHKVQVCHGTTIPSGSPACLIVLQFSFSAFRAGKRFKWVDISMTFNEGGWNDGLEIICIAPEEQFDFHPSETTKETGHQLNAAVAAGPEMVKFTPAYTWHSTSTTTQQNYGRIVGKCLRGKVAKWSISENNKTKSGIPPLVQMAILVKRGSVASGSASAKFSAGLEIAGEMNHVDELEERAKGISVIGRTRAGADIVFTKEERTKGNIKDESNLTAVNWNELQRLAVGKHWPVDKDVLDKTIQAAPEMEPANKQFSSLTLSNKLVTEKVVPSPENHLETRPQSGMPAPPSYRPKELVFDGELVTNLKREFETAQVEQGDTNIKTIEPPRHLESPGVKLSSRERQVASLRSRLTAVRSDIKLLRRLFSLEDEEQCIIQEIN